ncbi:MAG: hypothetical protein Q4D85_08850 [Corynebacterium sp.]|uniref:hypothetical protein n=1 Tax=Corynebacterium sp. TaxID=1720 RepID=UPI0026DCC54E|nr:hypothetical protein [Corynebacterium sp.]MDO5098855.1 hypothetical protein [Corynebacterium sp.]
MTLQPRPSNPIEQRKQAVRRYSRLALQTGVGTVGTGLVLWALSGQLSVFVFFLLLGIAGVGYFWRKVNQIVNHKDNY